MRQTKRSISFGPKLNHLGKTSEDLPLREMVIVLTTLIDTSLADLISRRLKQDHEEIRQFLGSDGNGRAPLAAFGSKIAAAYLTGSISNDLRTILQNLKNLRNFCAHATDLDFSSRTAKDAVAEVAKAYVRLLKSSRVRRIIRERKSQTDIDLPMSVPAITPRDNEQIKHFLITAFTLVLLLLANANAECVRVSNLPSALKN
jgi:hypothetical protein